MTTMPDPPNHPSYQERVTSLARDLIDRAAVLSGEHFMLGVTGGPGAGKSTFADALCQEIDALAGRGVAIVVPMDGFHKTNRELHARGLWERKGEPETFDARGFVDLLLRIRHSPGQVTAAPLFDRVTDEPVADALRVEPSHRIVIVEGNYLLLPEAPWAEITGVLDEVWFLVAPEDIVVRRLEERHLRRGLSGAALEEKIAGSDLKNARRIAATRHLASRVLSLPAKQE